MSVFGAVDSSPHQHRLVPIRNIYGPAASAILAFAERPLLAKSSRQRAPSITTGLHPKPTLMSVFSLITSAIGGIADIIWAGVYGCF